jgi:hypothetical protein
MATTNGNGNVQKTEAVFIRKSTREQDETGQIGNVESMLTELGVCVPHDQWFVGTVSRRKVKANADFLGLMNMVETDRISTVYIESQDRWGTKDRPELFSLLGILRDHGTKLFDLRGKKDLTERDFATELLAFVGSVKSEKELQDISYRSLRTRVQQFMETGSWPTGTHPFGFGKACWAPDGTLKWEWSPVNRKLGQVFYPSPNGLIPGPANVKIPRKDKRDIVKLVPSWNADYVRAVRLIFDLYTRVGLSRRQIAIRLNKEGLLFNGGPFAHTNITDILRNPAYAGDTVFGKLQTGELHTFDAKGLIVEVKEPPVNRYRDISQCLIKLDTHKPLVDRKTWELAQQKLASEGDRTSHAPRNPDYYLKQIFVCGHCGRSMSPRTEIGPNGQRRIIYVCSSFLNGRVNGVPVQCGYQRITHDDAERMLLEKIKELSLPFDEAANGSARENVQLQLARLGDDSEESRDLWWEWLSEGVDALVAYMKDVYGLDGEALRMIDYATKDFYRLGGKLSYRREKTLPVALAEFMKAVREAEKAAVQGAEWKVAKLREEHRALTLNWAKATNDMQAVLKQEIERLEGEIRRWEPHTLPLTERFKRLSQAEAERDAERKRLKAEWPKLESREKGESLRRLFHTVKLYWDRTFHPSEKNPSRPRKTNRAGRFSYALRRDRIEWQLATSDSVTFW